MVGLWTAPSGRANMMIKFWFGPGQWEEMNFCLTLLAAWTFALNYISLHFRVNMNPGQRTAAAGMQAWLQPQRNNEKGRKRVNYTHHIWVIFTRRFFIIYDGSHKFTTWRTAELKQGWEHEDRSRTFHLLQKAELKFHESLNNYNIVELFGREKYWKNTIF